MDRRWIGVVFWFYFESFPYHSREINEIMGHMKIDIKRDPAVSAVSVMKSLPDPPAKPVPAFPPPSDVVMSLWCLGQLQTD